MAYDVVYVTPLGAQAPGRVAEAPPAQASSAPADEPYEDDDQALPPRVIYDAPQPAVYINPWPYLVIRQGVERRRPARRWWQPRAPTLGKPPTCGNESDRGNAQQGQRARLRHLGRRRVAGDHVLLARSFKRHHVLAVQCV